MINYLLNLKLVNGDGKFSVNLQVAGRPITEKSVSIRQQFANSVHKIFVFASAAKAASHCRRKRPQKADFHRDAVKVRQLVAVLMTGLVMTSKSLSWRVKRTVVGFHLGAGMTLDVSLE